MSIYEKFNNQPNIMADAQRLHEHPSEISEMLLNKGRINKEQYQQIKEMQNPKDICMYLMNQNPRFNQAMNMLSNFAKLKK
jgi:hypothetical protein